MKFNILKRIKECISLTAIKKFLGHYAGGIYFRVNGNHDFLMAGGLAFSLFVCIVPMVLIIFAILGRMFEIPSIETEINNFIDKAIPYPNSSQYIKDLVLDRMHEFRVNKNIAGLLGLLGLLLASSRLFSSMRTILNKVYKAPPGSILIGVVGKLRDFGMVILVLFYFLLSTTLLPAFELLKDSTKNNVWLNDLGLGFVGDFFLAIVSYLLIFFAFFIIYYLVPQIRLKLKVAIMSAAWAGVLWGIAEHFFRWYIRHLVTLKEIYGAYVLIIVVIFWIYYTSIVFIVGAEIGQLYNERLKPSQT